MIEEDVPEGPLPVRIRNGKLRALSDEKFGRPIFVAAEPLEVAFADATALAIFGFALRRGAVAEGLEFVEQVVAGSKIADRLDLHGHLFVAVFDQFRRVLNLRVSSGVAHAHRA